MAEENEVRFVGGPNDGDTYEGSKKSELLAIPLDCNLHVQKENPDDYYALAIYRLQQSEGEEAYVFQGAQRKNPDEPFAVEFIDGPMKGVHPFQQPIQLFEAGFRIPLSQDKQVLKRGSNVAAMAEYRRKLVDGVWKMALENVNENPSVSEFGSDLIAERQRIEELDCYTSDQLVKALTKRPGFKGLVVMIPGEVQQGVPVEAGHDLLIMTGVGVSKQNAITLLRSALTSLDGTP